MSAQPIELEPAPEARPAVTLSVAALAVFETIAEMRVVSVVLEHARPGEKLTVERIHELLGGERKTETSVKRGIRTALANETLVAVPLSKGGRVRTYVAGPKLVGLVRAQSVPESDKPTSGTECAQMVDVGTTRARTLSDSGTKCAQKTGTESAQNAVPSTATVVDTRARAAKVLKNQDSLKPEEELSPKERGGADAPTPRAQRVKRSRAAKPKPEPREVLAAETAFLDVFGKAVLAELREDYQAEYERLGDFDFRWVLLCWKAAGWRWNNYSGILDWLRSGVPEKYRLARGPRPTAATGTTGPRWTGKDAWKNGCVN